MPSMLLSTCDCCGAGCGLACGGNITNATLTLNGVISAFVSIGTPERIDGPQVLPLVSNIPNQTPPCGEQCCFSAHREPCVCPCPQGQCGDPFNWLLPNFNPFGCFNTPVLDEGCDCFEFGGQIYTGPTEQFSTGLLLNIFPSLDPFGAPRVTIKVRVFTTTAVVFTGTGCGAGRIGAWWFSTITGGMHLTPIAFEQQFCGGGIVIQNDFVEGSTVGAQPGSSVSISRQANGVGWGGFALLQAGP